MSGSIKDGKDFIKQHILSRIDSSGYKILDLGCGKGTYGKLLKKACYIVGVDAMPYKEKFQLMRYYDEFLQADIRTLDADFVSDFDMIIMGDVLEHLTYQDASKLLKYFERLVDTIILAVPYRWKQSGRGNDWEIHRQDDLDKIVFAERYPEFKRLVAYTSDKRPWHGAEYYAYYEWRREYGKNGTPDDSD